MPIDHENEIEYSQINQTFKYWTQKNLSTVITNAKFHGTFFLITEL